MIFQVLSVKNLVKKLVVAALVILSFLANILIYNKNQEEINHYKPYYAESVLFAAEHKVSVINGNANAKTQVENAKSVPVLVYHGVLDKPDEVSGSLKDFKDQMFALKKEGYQTVHVNDFNEYIQGKKQLPDKSFMITFDDGRKDSYYPVDPILAELNYSAVMFLIGSTFNYKTNKFHLVKEEIQKMKESGRWDIEAHTFEGHGNIQVDAKGTQGHFYSNKKWLTDKNRLETDDEYKVRIKNDFTNIKASLSKEFGTSAIGFAFPFGDYGQETVNFPQSRTVLNEEVSQAFPLLFYQADEEKGYSFNMFAKDEKMIKRINIGSKWSDKDLISLLGKGQEKKTPLKITGFDQNQGWTKNFGSVYFSDTKMSISANDETKGSNVFLDGTSSWGNYKYEVDINKNNNEDEIVLMVNYKNAANYIYMSYSKGIVKLVNKVENVDNVLATSNIENISNENNVFTVIVNDKYVSGLINNKEVVTAPINLNKLQGGVGIGVWNDTNFEAKISINSIEVTRI